MEDIKATKDSENPMIPLIMVTLFAISTIIFSDKISSIWVTIILTFSSATLWLFSKILKKVIFKHVGLVILLQFVLFPWLYSFLINSSQNYFLLEGDVVNLRKEVVSNEFELEIKKSRYNEKINCLDTLLSSFKSNILPIRLDEINDRLIKTGIFFVQKGTIEGHYIQFDRHIPVQQLKQLIKIYDIRNGELIYYTKYRKNDSLLYDVLVNEREIYKNQLKKLINLSQTVEKGGFLWGYNSLLPYLLTYPIINTNIKPISPLSNVLTAFHYLIVFILVAKLISISWHNRGEYPKSKPD
jgi:hypothetical protein